MGILVTEGTRGLGRAVVLMALRRGTDVVFSAPAGDEAAARDLLAEAARINGGARAAFVTADITREADVDRMFDESLDCLPDGLRAIVTVCATGDEPAIDEMTLAQWNDTLDHLVRAPFLVARRGLEEFMVSGGGSLVHAIVGPRSGAGAASAAAALQTLTRAVAKEYGVRHVRCNGVSVASPLDSDLVAAAEVVMFLISPAAAFVTGEVLPVAASPGVTATTEVAET